MAKLVPPAWIPAAMQAAAMFLQYMSAGEGAGAGAGCNTMCAPADSDFDQCCPNVPRFLTFDPTSQGAYNFSN